MAGVPGPATWRASVRVWTECAASVTMSAILLRWALSKIVLKIIKRNFRVLRFSPCGWDLALIVGNNSTNASIIKHIDSVPDPGSGVWPLDPVSEIQDGWKVRIRIRDQQPESYFRELRNCSFGLKYLNSFMGIQDSGWKKFGSGINISDPQTLHIGFRISLFSCLIIF
jgi:hypothetical protein